MIALFFIVGVISVLVYSLNFRKIFVLNYRQKKVLLFGLPLSLMISVPLFFLGDDYLKKTAFLYLIVSLIGFFDDVYGSTDKGIKGHFNALLKGRITTGLIKLVSIAGISFYMALIFAENIYHFFIVFFLLASFSNLFNLLDLRPGRAIKSSIFLFVLIFLFSKETFFSLYLVFFSYLIYLYFDLKEVTMLGDAGSNSLGFLIGNLLIITVKILWVQFLLAFSGVLLNLLSEKISFSEIIKKNRILKFFDEIGRVSHEA